MRRIPPTGVLIVACLFASGAVAEENKLPKDRTQRGALAMETGANTLSLPAFLAPFARQPVPRRRFGAETGLAALHARNRYGTTVTCVDNPDCTGVTPTPVSPKDRAILMQRGIKALPPGRPVFLEVPNAD